MLVIYKFDLLSKIGLKEQKRIIFISLITGFVLMMAKFGAYLITASNFVLTDAAESIVNVIASAFAFFSIYLSSRPRDENHPYGHGKVEYFSVFIEGSLISIAGVIIIIKSVYSLFYDPKGQVTALYNVGCRWSSPAYRYGNQCWFGSWFNTDKINGDFMAR